MAFEEILSYSIWGNTVQDYLIAVIIFLASLTILRLFKYVVLRKLKKLAKKTKWGFDDLLIGLLDKFGWPFFMLVSFYLAFQYIAVPEIVDQIMHYAILLIGAYYVVHAVMSVIDYGSKKAAKKREAEEADTTVIDLMRKIIKMVVIIAAFLFILVSLGYDITGALAGIGVSGIIIGFALQNVLSDIFASFSLYFDKPFKKGDFIVVGEDLGVVQKIGIKSTRIKHLHGEEVTISNRELTSVRVHNYKKMERRRVVFNIGVTYDTPSRKLKKAVEIVKGVIKGIKDTELERVHFKSYGDFSLNIEVAYYVLTAAYGKYMDIQQEINFAIKEKFEKEGIEFAYPTQTVFVNRQK
jgi:small-conductance mechanosensitive channel